MDATLALINLYLSATSKAGKDAAAEMLALQPENQPGRDISMTVPFSAV